MSVWVHVYLWRLLALSLSLCITLAACCRSSVPSCQWIQLLKRCLPLTLQSRLLPTRSAKLLFLDFMKYLIGSAATALDFTAAPWIWKEISILGAVSALSRASLMFASSAVTNATVFLAPFPVCVTAGRVHCSNIDQLHLQSYSCARVNMVTMWKPAPRWCQQHDSIGAITPTTRRSC